MQQDLKERLKKCFFPVRNLVLTGIVLGVSACGYGKPYEPYEDPRNAAGGVKGDLNTSRVTDLLDTAPGLTTSGDSLTPVNCYLWRASLDTLSYLPLASTDPFTGVVATDWASNPSAPGERLKVTAYVKSTVLAAKSLEVAVYREVQQEGTWVTAPVAPETARKLEDAILLRARELKIEDREAS